MSDSPSSQSTPDVVAYELSLNGVTRVISDLHIGHPGSLFSEVEEIFPLLDGAERLILNGDTTEECSRVVGPRSEEMFGAFCAEAARRGVELMRLRGNHDASLSHIGALRLFGEKVLIMHGDACYHYGSPWSRWLPDLKVELDAVYRTFEQEGINTLEDKLRLAQAWARSYHPPIKSAGSKMAGIFGILKSAVWPPSVGWRLLKERALTVPRAVEFLDRFSAETQVMIFGHIHRSGVWNRGRKILINTGAFQPLAGRCACDLDEQGITVRDVVRSDGRFVLGEVKQTITWRSLGIDPLHVKGDE